MVKRLRAGIIGATGMVGQQFVTLLEDHPWFEVVNLAASSHSAGKPYSYAIENRWKLQTPCPDYAREMTVYDASADSKEIAEAVDLVFCAVDLGKEATIKLEAEYAAAGVAVISNNSANRWTKDVPMLIPEINAAHAAIIDVQRKNRGWKTGLIAVKPNCSIQSYTIVLTAMRKFSPEFLHVTSMQAVSGAGKTLEAWPEMIDNVIPYIGGEEEKSEEEPLKIWGDLRNGEVLPAGSPAVAASCVRVPVSDGHLADVSVKFKKKANKAQLLEAIEKFGNPLADMKLPSSPKQLIHYFDETDRPQVRLDRDLEHGMGISLGRLRELPPDNPYDFRFVSLAHNTVRGAAGGGVLMAELLMAQGYITGKSE